MKAFREFADHPVGGWIIEGFSVVAFILALKLLVSRFSDQGKMASVKAVVQSI